MTSAIMSNYSEVKGGNTGCKSASYQRDLSKKVVQAINKQKGASTSHSRGGQVKSAKPKFIGDLPKTKSFAENLMNMLAK
jgi:hypothetical protein